MNSEPAFPGGASHLRITLPYAILGALWILFTDLAVNALIDDPDQLTVWAMAKGWVFVGATTALLAVLVQRAVAARQQRDEYFRELKRLVRNLRGVPYRCRNDGKWTMLRMHGEVEATLGYRTEQLLLNRDVAYIDVIHPDDRDLVRHWVRQAVVERRPFEMRYRVVRNDGDVRCVAERGRPLFDVEGEGTLLEGYIYDDTKVARLEEELRHVDKMNAIERVVGSAAHDFNNYLMAISMNAHLLKSNEAGRESANAIEQAAGAAMKLSTKLLDFAYRREVERERLDLNELIRDRMALFESLVGAKVELTIELTEEALFIRADEGEIEQILTNLIINAVDASERGDRIKICTELGEQGRAAVPVAGSFTASVVCLKVIDEGKGMDEETRERLFEPFFTTKGERGRGIGLASVYGVVNNLGGRISVDSAPGEGTTFEIALPAS